MAPMSDDDNQDVAMAQCGACDSIIPLDSQVCQDCGVRIGGISKEVLGECGACGVLLPVDSISCNKCGVFFVDINDKAEITSDNDETDLSNPVEITDSDEITIESDHIDEVEDDVTETEIETHVEYEIDDVIETEVAVEEIQEDTEDHVEEEESTDGQETADVSTEKVELSEDEEDVVEEEQYIETTSEDIEEGSVEEGNEISPEDEEEVSIEESLEEEQDQDSTEDDVDESQIETEEQDGVDEAVVKIAFENLALAIAEQNMTAAEAFMQIDTSDDNKIDAPELQKGIQNIAGEKLTPKEITAILDYLDADSNRRIDSSEFFTKIEELRIGISQGKLPKVKQFPSPTQKFLMGKKANDIFYPIMYFLMAAFVGLWVVNGMGLLVDGTGGNVVYEGHTDANGDELESGFWDICNEDIDNIPEECSGTVRLNEVYPCDPKLDSNDCANSLTPFSGENGASSMPAGFYTDGYIFIGLGVVGLLLTFYLHKMYAPKLRKIAKGDNASQEEEDSEIEDDDSEDADEQNDEAEEQSELEDDELEEDSDEDEEYDDEDYDDEDYEDDDEIDVGSWIGLEIDGEEYFGEILEFNDDKGTVTIETEEGEEITGDQDDMFLEDDE